MQKTWVLWILGLAVLVIAAWYNLEAIGLNPDIKTADLVKLLSALLFISLIVERVLEVFISAWRGEGKEKLEFKVNQLKRALAWQEIEKKASPQQQIEEDQVKRKLNELGEAEKKLGLYRVETKYRAVHCGVFLGILVAALGFRTLQPFLDPGTVEGLSQLHTTFLRTTDVVLTGGVIGGGSDGLHKVIQAFTDFMESTSKKAKGASEPKPWE